MEHPSGGLYLPFIQSSILGVGVGMISMSPTMDGSMARAFGESCGTPIDIEKFTHQDRANIRQNPIVTQHNSSPSVLAQAFASMIKNLTPGVLYNSIRGWIGFNEGTFVPILNHLHLITNESLFIQALEDYPMHRVTDTNKLYQDLLACYIRADESPKKHDIFCAMGLLLGAFGYPYPGIGFRWTFKLQNSPVPDYSLGLTWIPQPDLDPANIETTYIPEIAKEYCPALSSGTSSPPMQLPTISNPIMDRLIFVAPVSLSGAKITSRLDPSGQVPIGRIIHELDTIGIEARRMDYMYPIATSHIALDGTITMI